MLSVWMSIASLCVKDAYHIKWALLFVGNINVFCFDIFFSMAHYDTLMIQPVKEKKITEYLFFFITFQTCYHKIMTKP